MSTYFMPGHFPGSFFQVISLCFVNGPGRTWIMLFPEHLSSLLSHQWTQALAERFSWGKEHSRRCLKETDLPSREGCRQQWQDEGPSECGTQDHDGLDSRPACRASVSWALLFSLLRIPPHSPTPLPSWASSLAWEAHRSGSSLC